MIATALEHNGAIVYIASRRLEIIEKAAREHNVSAPSPVLAAGVLTRRARPSATGTLSPCSAT